MRSYILLAFLLVAGRSFGQGNGFSFSYTGPNQIIVGPDCVAPLDWGHPNTPTVSSNIPGGTIVSFNIYSISQGYQIGDLVGGGNTITVFYQAIDNYGNNALFGFSIAFIDIIPPVFDDFTTPDNLTVSCTGDFPVADVEVFDNCDDQDIVITVNFTENNNAQPCTGGVITRTWVADDDLGNFATFVQTITVLPDNTPPTIANNLVNGSAPCSTAMAQYTTWLNAQRAAFTATDNGCGLMSKTDNAPNPATITSFCGPVPVTFTAADNCNNSSSVERTFTITNNVPPVITNPASDASGNCNQSNIQMIFNNWIATHGGATATDDCSGVLWSTSPPSPSLSDTCGGPIHVLFIAGDGCGNFDTTSANFVLTDDTPPVISTNPSSMVLNCASPTVDSLLLDWLMKSGSAVASDLCTPTSQLVRGYKISGAELTLEGVLNAWQDSLAGDCRDGVIINGVGINNVKAYLPLEFTFTDACGNVAGRIGYFGVTDNGGPEFITLPRDTSFTCAQSQGWQEVFEAWYASAGGATFMDQCSEISVQASITADSAIQYLSAALDTGCMQGVAVQIGFTLRDECGNASSSSPMVSFSLQDTLSPVITNPASDFAASCALDGQTQLQNWLDTLGGAEANDGCGALIWSFSWTDTSGMNQTGFPFTGPYPTLGGLDCAGGISIIFTAADACQNTVSDTAIFSLIDTEPPVITIAEDTIHLFCTDTMPVIEPEVTDACNGDITLVYTDAAGIDSCLGTPEVIIRTWTATDECGNSSTALTTFLRIDSIAPTFTLPPDTVSFCSADTLALMDVSDNCDPFPISSFEDMITGPACQQTLIRTWMVSDACGNVATAEQQFDLSDTTPPVIETSPGDFIYTCNEGSVNDAYNDWQNNVSISDGCSESDYFIALPGSYSPDDTSTWPGTPLPASVVLACDTEVSISGELVAYDACGNVVVEEISFVVQDTAGPTFVNCPGVLVVEPDTATCSGLAQLTPPEFEEICYPDSVSITLTIDGGESIPFDTITSLDTILRVGIHTAIWTATDCKGNSGTCQTSIEIIDENAVALTCPADTLLFASEDNCTQDIWVFPPQTTSSKCAQGVVELRMEVVGDAEPDSVVFVSASDSVLVAFHGGLNQVLLIARDSTGDIDTCIYIVELRDTIAPVILCQSDTVILHPSGLDTVDLSLTSLLKEADDNCGIANILYEPHEVTCESAGQTLDVMVIALDGTGNADTCLASLVVQVQPLIPAWEKALCNDTLRLFTNIPAGPDADYIISWTGPNGFSSNEENPVIPESDSTFNGIYTVTIQSENGCASTGTVEVTITSLASPEITLEDDTACTGHPVTLHTQPYGGDISYQWYQITPEGDTVITTSSEPQITIVAEISGDYIFFANVTQDTCTTEPGMQVTLHVVAPPVAEIADITLPLCAYDTLFLSPVTISDSLSYEWTGSGGFVSNDPVPPGIPVSELDSASVFYLVVTNEHCSSSPDSVEITLQPSPATPVIFNDSVTCEGGRIVLSTNVFVDEYTWIDPQQNEITTADIILVIDPATEAHEGDWHLVITDNGCRSDTAGPVHITVDTALNIEILEIPAACEGDSITLQFSPSVSGTFTWTGPGGFVSMEASPEIPAVDGIYHLIVSTTTLCEDSDSIEVQVDALPNLLSIETDADSCVTGNDDIRLWAITDPVSEGQFIFNWEGPSGFMSQDSSPVISNFNTSLNGAYSLFITNGNCVSDTVSVTIEVTDNPIAPVINGDNVYCSGDSIILSIETPIEGAVYTWTFQGSSIDISSPGTLVIPDADSEDSDTYAVAVNVNGCASPSATIAVLVRPMLAAPTVDAPSLVCEGGTLTLATNAPAGSIVMWIGPNGFESNETSPEIFPALPENSGDYFAYYISNGCASDTSTAKQIVVQPTLTSPGLLVDVSAVCIDDPLPFSVCIDPATSTSGGSYAWYVNGELYVQSADSCLIIDGDPLAAELNQITAIAILNGCMSEVSASIDVQGDEFPSVSADAGIDMQYCPGEEIVLDAVPAGPASGLWSSVDPEIVFDDPSDPLSGVNSLPPGQYTLTWTLSFASCINYSSDEVVIDIIPSPEIRPDTFEVPFGQTVEFIVIANDTLGGIPFILETVSGTTHGNVLYAGNGVFRYTPNIGFVGTDMMVYRICSTDCPEECEEALVVLLVGDEDDCITPTLFTPNSDGINDELVIPCLETDLYPNNKIMVFNEWGDAVFVAAPYENNWEGTSNGDALPVGTYFYIMDFGDGSTPKRSFLVLER